MCHGGWGYKKELRQKFSGSEYGGGGYVQVEGEGEGNPFSLN